MIKIIGMSSEHTTLPRSISNYFNNIFCTYAWIETDEINSDQFAISIIDYKPKRYRGNFVFSEPIWQFIEEERTEEQQKFIDNNLDKINKIAINYLINNGYLETRD